MRTKFKAILSVVMIAALALIFCAPVYAQQAPANFEGNWTMYATNIDDGQVVEKHVQIAQYGTQITGYFEGPFQSGPIMGEVTGNRIHFITQTRNPVNFHGEIFGDNITGQYIFHGNTAAWQAVRTTGIGAPQSVVTYAQPQVAVPTPVQNQVPNPVPTYSWQQPQQQQAAQQQTSSQPQPQNTYNQRPQQQQYSGNSQQQSSNNAQPQQSSDPNSQQQSAPAPAPMTSEQLNSLVAPIALYPDSLVAQILAAAANPDEITDANTWLGQNSGLTGQDLANAVNQESWDPSVKALTQFPSVLANLANNLQWTSSLGQAFYYQQSDVMAAVQVMRAKAQAAGTLQSNSQITVTQPSSSTIVIQPANPQVVYVPQYNPTIVYGAPVTVPLYTPAVVVATPTIGFSAGIAIGAWFGGGGGAVAVGGGGGFNWGWGAWGCNWGGGGGGGNTIIFNNNTYIHNNTWHTNNYNNYHNWGPGGTHPGGYVGPNGYYHPDPGYKPGTDTHYGPNGAYHPNGYFGPDGGWHQNPSSRNGGDNGNHGLIGGNGGTQHPVNGGGNSPGGATPDGGHNGDHGLIGGNGGVQHQPDGGHNGDGGKIGGNGGVDHGPDGGRNGDHGLIGGNGGVQHDADRDRENRAASQSRMSGDGRTNRTEANRGQRSMSHPRPVHQSRPVRTHAAPHPSGGGRRR